MLILGIILERLALQYNTYAVGLSCTSLTYRLYKLMIDSSHSVPRSSMSSYPGERQSLRSELDNRQRPRR